MHECWCPEVQTIACVYHLSTMPYPPPQLFAQLSTDSCSVRCGLAGRGLLLTRNRSDRALYERVRHAEIYYLESACRVAVVRLSIALHLDGDRERTGM